MNTRRPYIVGLTGGIGSGKSAAADGFAAHGITVVDTDVIAHALTSPDGAAIPTIRRLFGEHMIAADGSMDRARMRALVFSAPESRRQLEAILHPMIQALSAQLCADATSPYVILAVPLLIESGRYRERCDRICVVDCPEALQIERVGRRSGLSASQVQAIMQAQAPRAERLAAADDVINNSGSLDDLRKQVGILNEGYISQALLARQA